MNPKKITSSSSVRFLRWPILAALLVALFFVVGISTIRETYQGWQGDQEVKGLRAEVEALEGKKAAFIGLIEKLNSPDELDKQARSQLGLQKEGERVLILPLEEQSAPPSSVNGKTMQEQETLSNPQKWFRYFFHRRTPNRTL